MPCWCYAPDACLGLFAGVKQRPVQLSRRWQAMAGTRMTTGATPDPRTVACHRDRGGKGPRSHPHHSPTPTNNPRACPEDPHQEGALNGMAPSMNMVADCREVPGTGPGMTNTGETGQVGAGAHGVRDGRA